MLEMIVETSDRLDAFLASQVSDFSRSKIQKAIKSGFVRVNGSVIRKPAFILQEADTVVFAFEESAKDVRLLKPENMSLEILYEDEACFVFNKPSGIAVHPAPGMPDDEKTLLHGIAYVFTQKKIVFSEDAVLVHRLDRETTGCILVAKNADVHHALQKQFEERSVSKTYLAIVSGVPKSPSATIDAPIGRNLTDRTRMSVVKTSVSREAQTSYTTLDTSQYTALLSCDLHTGRTHQIRVHLSSIGHPILGDPTYASMTSQKHTEEYGVKNLCLHSWKLSFVSPVDGKKHPITAPLPALFTDALENTELSLEVL